MSRSHSLRFGAFSLRMFFGVLLAAEVASACEGSPWIRLEVTAGEMAGNEAAEWVEIDRSGCVLSGYPVWDIRAGVYQRTMSADEKSRLESTLQSERIMTFDAPSEREAIAASESKSSDGQFARTLFTINDADQVRLLLDDAGSWKSITWHSPTLELEHRREIAARAGTSAELDGLERLVNVLEAVRKAGDHAAKSRIADVKP